MDMHDIPLWSHQRKVLELNTSLTSFGLLWEVGTGKSRGLIEILRQKYAEQGELLRTIIICPPIMIEKWKREILQYSKIQEKEIILLIGTGKQREAKIPEEVKILVTNYETLLMKPVLAKLIAYGPTIVIADESHKLKNGASKRTKGAVLLADKAKHKYILSGTPVLQSLLDIFYQWKFLDGGETFGKNFIIFRNEYFYDNNAGMPSTKHFPDWRIRPGAEKKISTLMSRNSMRIKKADCLDLPPLVRKLVYVQMSPEQMRHYTEMRKHLITFLNEKASTASIALTKALRLQQIVSGFLKMEDGSILTFEENPRLKALEELLEDLSPQSKIIVWACFKEDYGQIKKICEKLGLQYREVHGDIPQKDRQEAVDSFNTNPEVRVFIGNQGAGGIGIDLVQSNCSIYYSRNFSLEHDLQSEARNHRGGSEIHSRVTRIDLVTQGTIDEKVLQALASKQEIGEKVLRDLIIGG